MDPTKDEKVLAEESAARVWKSAREKCSGLLEETLAEAGEGWTGDKDIQLFRVYLYPSMIRTVFMVRLIIAPPQENGPPSHFVITDRQT